MIFRTLLDGDAFIVSVEDDDGVVFTVPASTKAEAAAIVKQAVHDGFESIRPEEKPVKKKVK